jgi:AcrR family transcriptional regulator
MPADAPPSARHTREAAIIDAAFKLLSEKGYGATSMLAVARAAKASNETLYRWYGDKNGLFRALIVANAAEVKAHLDASLAVDRPPLEVLGEVLPMLLELLTSDRAIVLNRAAAADPTGVLGQALTEAGRETVGPLLARVVEAAMRAGVIREADLRETLARLLDLLVGDLQIRRAIGAVPALSRAECRARAARALSDFLVLFSP